MNVYKVKNTDKILVDNIIIKWHYLHAKIGLIFCNNSNVYIIDGNN